MPSPLRWTDAMSRDTRISTPAAGTPRGVEHMAVGHRHPLPQPHVLGHDGMMKRSTTRPLGDVAEHAPAHAPLRGGSLAAWTARRKARAGPDRPVVDLDQHGTVVGIGGSTIVNSEAGRPRDVASCPCHADPPRRACSSAMTMADARARRAFRRSTPRRPRTRCPPRGSPAPRRAHRHGARRTHGGAVLWVPADRLAKTHTHAMPAPNVPTTANAVKPATAISRMEAIHSNTAVVTTPLSERRRSCAGMESAPTTAPVPNPPIAGRIRRHRGPAGRVRSPQQGQNTLAQMANVRLRRISERIAGECRANRIPLNAPRPDVPARRAAAFARSEPADRDDHQHEAAALTTSALPELIHAAIAPASAGPRHGRR